MSDPTPPTPTTAGNRRTHALAEVLGQPGGALLGVLPVALDRKQGEHDAADDGDRRRREGRREVDRQGVGDPVQPREWALGRVVVGAWLGDQGHSEDHDLLAGQAEAVQRVPRAGAALEGGADQVGAEPALHVGAGAHPQQVQRHELGGVRAWRCPFGSERRPSPPRSSRAPRPRRGPRSRPAALLTLSAPSVAGSTTTGPVAAVEVAEDPALGEHPGVPLGHLAAEDRLDPRRVGLVLAAGEGEHPRAAVLDGDGRVEQRAIALATANRSPDGRPPSDSGSAAPTSPSASSERSSAASCAHGRAAAQPEQRRPPASIAAARPPASPPPGARTTSRRRRAGRAPAAARRASGGRRTPTPSTSARGG